MYVWVGFDAPDEAVYKKRGVSAALAKTCSTLAENVYIRAEEARKAAAAERREQETPQGQTSL